MSKILRGLLIVFACVVGLLLQPCRADEPISAYDPGSLVYVPLVLDQSWNGNSVVVESSPQGIAMHKVTRVLYYLNSETQELEQFTRLEQLPRYLPMYKFEGFYTEPNGAGTKIIDYAGSPVESGVNALPTENYGGYILLYPNFVALTQLKLNTNGGRGGTAFLYFLRHTIDNDLCGVWLNEYGEERNEVSIEKPEREGYFFDGYHISRNATSTQWIGEDGNISDIRQVVCENIFLLRENTLYAAWSQCAEGQYKSGEECLPCPADNINVGENELYKFVASSGTGIAGCRIKLNTDKSKCAAGTDVIYTYNPNTGKYENTKSTIVLGSGIYITKLDDVLDNKDYCGSCAIGGGKYVDDKGFCRDCPTTNDTGCLNCDEGDIGNGGLYNFVEGTGTGLSSCTVKLNNTTCGAGTVVKYAYDSSKKKYIRQNGYIIKEENAPVLTGTAFPKEDELKDYCEKNCDNENEYYVNGKCGPCNNGYYKKGGKCIKCPAGYACPKVSETSIDYKEDPMPCKDKDETEFCKCDKDEYSEVGASICTKCASGYTTKYSGSESDTDGLCLEAGKKCVSPNACKLLMDARLCYNFGCSEYDDFGLGAVKIMSTNQSVVKTRKKNQSGE